MTFKLTYGRFKMLYAAAKKLELSLASANIKIDLSKFRDELIFAKAYCYYADASYPKNNWKLCALDLMREIRDIYASIPFGQYYLSYGKGLGIRNDIEKMFKEIFNLKPVNHAYCYLDYFRKAQVADQMLSSINSYIQEQHNSYKFSP